MTSMWTALCDGRGGGEHVQERGDTRKNATGGRKVGYRGEMKISRKLVEIDGAVELE